MSSEQKLESLQELLTRTILEGAPLYNNGDKEGCFNIYFDTTKYACMQAKISESAVGQVLEQAADEAMSLGEADKFGEGAWVLRRSFDVILEKERSNRRQSVILSDATNDSDDNSVGYWQDESAQNTTDAEKAQALADVYTILLSSIEPSTHTRFGKKTFDACFPATSVVETLIMLGLAAHRKMAVEKANLLREASLLKSVSHESEASFVDGTHLYRFPTQEEMEYKSKELDSSASLEEGSDAAICALALQTILETGDESSKINARRASLLPQSPEHMEGTKLAAWAQVVESVVDVADRKHNLKTYSKCFVGSDAIGAVVAAKDLPTMNRTDGKALLNKLLHVGIVYHVTREHEVEDKKLFYRFASPKELQTSMDSYNKLTSSVASGAELVRYVALVQRFKQFAGLDITEILNSFYGATPEEFGQDCWDKPDLQNWRNNMKRWGFGRREDQDDAMVDKLSPLLAGVNPDTWEAPSEEWWSPWGILAQIAIFDQVSRSAFRGTSDAFKWDQLAIKATKVAIERGYFEMVYKSTLNQFVILLPLEHSESWEDQKLGVNLLLQMLSKVAIEDEGFSDYEIVKRLEFSKRLTTAFLEHAQVIAKFKRYPHRNKAHTRATSIEERIWLASDLVPRWAKSQQHAETGDGSTNKRSNIVQLPVIPLKRLTRGR
mmetsp:Transcript_16737/g.27773  ORF Transcript_16737/g.27773 Transcript_16737/m.27773 type:complete len:666 (+) Transcript_16737:135-2132(+)|eukprot:CAMPEP_0119005198 /NCGR_PEP_ID=MMETSP1176-20130426/1578_1 /TAXON_ID=265551 /ORGANISM="Synedropsis recta cf, Strain CCMP1620" /LENGTH=665 /DNA_ID=CAMNT_0006956975 /DNA_START=134 /DNA_END=2131 /DNA_ORIENTATION=+